METSRSDGTDERPSSPADESSVQIDPEPAPAETAAIVAALHGHLEAEQERTTRDTQDAAWWRERGWRLQGRFRTVRGATGRPRDDLPQDPWRAADRVQRL